MNFTASSQLRNGGFPCPASRAGLAAWGALLCVAIATGCAPVAERNHLARWIPSANYNARDPILVVLHATEQESVEQSLRTLRSTNPSGRVSAHYLIGRNGGIFQLVAEDRRAWHAGAGSWGTISDINSASIGIELDNNGSDPYPPVQMQALLRLLEDVCKRQGIPRSRIVGHADVAPTRKTDPGKLFPWSQLASAGFGIWPTQPLLDPPATFDPVLALHLIGYPTADRRASIRAFKLRFRGTDDSSGEFDSEDRRILFALQAGLNIQ